MIECAVIVLSGIYQIFTLRRFLIDKNLYWWICIELFVKAEGIKIKQNSSENTILVEFKRYLHKTNHLEVNKYL